MPRYTKSLLSPLIDKYLQGQQQEYPKDYFRASSAGYCQRYVIMKRLGVTPVEERSDTSTDLRIFAAGHIFHEWMQRITKDAGISVAQELEVVDDELGVKGHFDDLVLVDDKPVLYDYKTQNSRAFTWQMGRPMSSLHRMQLGTYMYMLRQKAIKQANGGYLGLDLTEARILKISKDDLRMKEEQLLWTPELENDVVSYWRKISAAWDHYQKTGELPPCECLKIDDGWFGRKTKAGKVYNDYYYEDEPCSQKHFNKWLKETKNVKV